MRRRWGVAKVRSQSYRVARDLGNVEAVEHGYRRGGVTGAAVGGGKRIARRAVYRHVNRGLASLLRRVGL